MTPNKQHKSPNKSRGGSSHDLASFALHLLDADEAQSIEARVAQSPRESRELDDIAAHLVMYDRIEGAPPAPTFEQFRTHVKSSDDVDAPQARLSATVNDFSSTDSSKRWFRLGMAAVALLAIGAAALWGFTRDRGKTNSSQLASISWVGPSVQTVADGAPAPLKSSSALQPGTWLYGGEDAGEVRYTTRNHTVRLVLSSGASLRYTSPTQVYLEKGKAWFEVTRLQTDTNASPITFRVYSPRGAVNVLGTSFLVDVNRDAFSVGVWHGAVEVKRAVQITQDSKNDANDAFRVGARESLAFHSSRDASTPAPTRAPFASLPAFLSKGLELSTRVVADGKQGDEWIVDCVFRNRGGLRLSLNGDDEGQSPLWLHVSDAQGGQVSALPVLPVNIVSRSNETDSDAELAPWIVATSSGQASGADSILAPGESRVVRVRFKAPRVRMKVSDGPLPRYVCRAVYRGEALPPLQSAPVPIHAAPSPLKEDEAAENGSIGNGSERADEAPSDAANGESKSTEQPGR